MKLETPSTSIQFPLESFNKTRTAAESFERINNGSFNSSSSSSSSSSSPCDFDSLYDSTGKSRTRPCCRNAIPKTYPVIGCLISFYTNRNRLHRNRLLDRYTELLTESPSGTVVFQRLAARRTVVTANPSNVEYILKTNFDNYPKGKPFTEILGDFLGDGIFNVDGNLWLKQRRLATHDFTPKSLREYVTILRNEVDTELLSFLDAAAEDSEPFDLQELLRRFSFNIVCIVFLGIDRYRLNPSSPVSEFDRAFQTAAAVSAGRGSAPLSFVWKLKRLVGFGSEKELRNAVGEVRSCVEEIIREKKRTKIAKSDLLSRLIAAGESEETVRDMVISIVMAGRDTTSAVTTRLFWVIAGHEETERDLVNEIRSVKEITGGFGYESLKKLSLLKACLCEVMRLYPPVPWDSKHALTGDRLPDGTAVRAGDRVTYFPYGMGRMEKLWGEDWDEYKPNRWFESYDDKTKSRVLKKVNPFEFPVFQAGPRVCLGEEMAYAQMKYVTTLWLRCLTDLRLYRWERQNRFLCQCSRLTWLVGCKSEFAGEMKRPDFHQVNDHRWPMGFPLF